MKRLFTFTIALAMCISMFPQAESLVVHNETAGELSKKIAILDQLTVYNLKLFGSINKDDLKFIGKLINNNLHGRIDLSDVELTNGYLSTETGDKNCFNSEPASISTLIYPKSIQFHKMYDSYAPLKGLTIDTLFFEAGRKTYDVYYYPGGSSGKIKHLFLNEKIDTLLNTHQTGVTGCYPDTLIVSSSIKYVGEQFIYDKLSHVNSQPRGLCHVNIDSLKNVEFIGQYAFFAAQTIDTLHVSEKLKYLYLASFNFKKNQEGLTHIYIPKSVEEISNYHSTSTTWDHSSYTNPHIKFTGKQYVFHMSNPNPPKLLRASRGDSPNEEEINTIVYVPKGAAGAYKASTSGWRYMNIIEERPIEEIHFEKNSISMETDEEQTLSISIYPSEPDDGSITLKSSNDNVARVKFNEAKTHAIITAVSPGKVKIYAVSDVNPLVKDSIEVTVIQHVTGIKLDRSSVVMTKLGETAKVNAIVSPEDATDKSVKWSSSNESVCLVQNGTLIAVGYGTSFIIATTNDGGYVATCVVTVTPYLYDLNGDGKVSTADIQVIINEMKKPQAEQDSKYDLNGDGKISTADIQVIINEMKN